MAYESIPLKQEISVNNIVSIHYFEYMSTFSFEGESHNFWEFLCVDKGTVNVMADNVHHTLEKGDVIFHKPNEFHNVTANGLIAPNLVVIGFECLSPSIKFFNNRLMKIGSKERDLLGMIIQEAMSTYACRLDDPYCQKLLLKEGSDIPFGSEQLIKVYLEQFLINLIRMYTTRKLPTTLIKSVKQKSEDDTFEKIVGYMEEHINQQLTIEQICRDNLIGRSILQKLFREHSSSGVIDYFSVLKIDAAKHMIRNSHLNFTQIADSLGYTSIHYFSRQFKKITGMTPSEYASSIKLLSEKKNKESCITL